MEPEVTVNNPVYVVRRRLGKKLDGRESREKQIENMERAGHMIDQNVSREIQDDYQKEIQDVLSDMEGDVGNIDGPPMVNKIGNNEDSEEEKIEKYMRVSSLQLAFQAYPVFKSIVVN